MKKEKEIEELKQKLSRYPFELNKGEKMMSIIISSIDQKIFHSIICKNTDKFNKLEDKLYEMKDFKEYSDYETYFMANGMKINRHKTLEDNKIKDNDIVLVNKIFN